MNTSCDFSCSISSKICFQASRWFFVVLASKWVFLNGLLWDNKNKNSLLNWLCFMVLYIRAKSFQNVTNPSRVIEWTRNTVIQCLILTLNWHLLNIHTAHQLIIKGSNLKCGDWCFKSMISWRAVTMAA